MADRYEIRNDLVARQPYPRNGNVGRQKTVVVYTVWDRLANRPVSSPFRLLREAKAFARELIQTEEAS